MITNLCLHSPLIFDANQRINSRVSLTQGKSVFLDSDETVGGSTEELPVDLR